MFSPLRNRFGIPGVISVIALVFAMFGGAYAATNNGGKATTSAKAKKGPRGPKGATGPAGPAGPIGPKGDTGARGDTGASGAPGVSATTTSFSGSKESCTAGGVEVKSASAPALVCNGKNGKNGAPWTPDNTLPSEATETGTWSFGALSESAQPSPGPGGGVISAISFPVALENPLGEGHVHFINTAGKELELFENPSFEYEIKAIDQPNPKPCPGTASTPEAEPGELCVYETSLIGSPRLASQLIGDPGKGLPNGASEWGAGRSGAILNAIPLTAPSGFAFGFGAWAVTAP
ncbi:MAG: hypothetical protein ABW196_09770 [Solirubrobacterales bacterium]